MGIIARQTAKNSIVLLLGALLGSISAILVYPLNEVLYGNVQFIIASSMVLMPFVDLGVGAIVVRFFPKFHTQDNANHGFLGLVYALILLGMILLSFVGFLFKEHFLGCLDLFGWETSRILDNSPHIMAVLFASVFISRTSLYLTNYNKVVWPSIFDNLMMKVLLPCIIVIVYLGYATYSQGKWLFVSCKLLAALLIIAYVYQLGLLNLKIDWRFLHKSLVKSMLLYAGYGLIGSLSSVLAFQIDTIMIAGFRGFSDTGIYGIAAVIANAIIIPSKSVNALAAAEISKLSSQDSLKSINQLYKKSSLTLLIGGLFIFGLLWLNISDLFELTSQAEKLKSSIFVVLFLGLAKLIDMITGVNGFVIAYSKYFRWNLIFIVIMGFLTISSNLYFIPRMGISGAALATLFSLGLFNILKFLFVWYVFRMQPFTWSTLKVLVVGGLCFLILWLLPLDFYPIVNIMIRSVLVVLLFGLPVYYFRFSEDISQAVEKYWDMGMKMLRLG